MDELIGPESGLNAIEAPSPIASNAVTVIERQQNLRRPPDRIRSLLPFQPSQSNGMARNWIPHIQAQADAQQTQLGTPLHHPRQKARQFAAIHEQVIGPFDLNRKAPLLKPLHHREGQRQAKQADLTGPIPTPGQCSTDPNTTWRRNPGTPPLADSPSLVSGNDSARPHQRGLLAQPGPQQVLRAAAHRHVPDGPMACRGTSETAIHRHQPATTEVWASMLGHT